MGAWTVTLNDGGSKIATAETVIFPISLYINRPDYLTALQEAKAIVEAVRKDVEQFDCARNALRIADMTNPQEGKTHFEFQLLSNEVQLNFTFALVLPLKPSQDVWDRMTIICQHLDFAQRLCKSLNKRKISASSDTTRFFTSAGNDLPKDDFPLQDN